MNAYIRELEGDRDVIVVMTDEIGRITYISEAIRRLAGYEPEEMMGVLGFEFLHFEDAEEGTRKLLAVSLQHGAIEEVTVRLKNAWGGWDRYDVRLENHSEDPEIAGMVAIHRPSTKDGPG